MSIQEEQLIIIGQQLGREPRGLVDIAADSATGVPLVLQMRSLVDDQPFPTLYWLCSKDLCKAIGQIEGRGWVKQIEARLQEDRALRQQYQHDQQRYVAQRWQAMHVEDQQRIEALKMTALFDQYGIGGITQWDNVRCLHMQYAHHLVDGNCIGALMDEAFALKDLVIRL
jgi:hypothetical protein